MSGGDLFGDRQIPNFRAKPPREWPEPEPPGLVGLAVVGVLAASLARLFDMGFAFGALFAAGCVATRAARNHRRVQQTLRPLTVALFLTYGPVTIATPFPPSWRFVFYGVIAGSAVCLYEWAAKH